MKKIQDLIEKYEKMPLKSKITSEYTNLKNNINDTREKIQSTNLLLEIIDKDQYNDPNYMDILECDDIDILIEKTEKIISQSEKYDIMNTEIDIIMKDYIEMTYIIKKMKEILSNDVSKIIMHQ